MPRCRSTVSDLRFPQLFLIVAGILIQLRGILHILALSEIFLEAPRLAALIRLWLDVARKSLTLDVRVIFFSLIARIRNNILLSSTETLFHRVQHWYLRRGVITVL